MPAKILLIRLRPIGDVIFTTPAIRAVRRAFPDASITYLVEEHAAAVVRDNPHLDWVMVIDRAGGWRRTIQDLTIAPTTSPSAFRYRRGLSRRPARIVPDVGERREDPAGL